MNEFLTYTVTGLVTAALYSIAASGLVVTYTTSGIFNFAHGAFGMLAAFVYWQLRVDWAWPAPLALLAVLGVLAPSFGVAIERGILRGVAGAGEVTTLVVSTSLLFGVFQGAFVLFPPRGRRLPGFFDGRAIDLGVVDLAWHDAITILAAVATAIALRFVLYGTRAGVAMRGVVDDRDLTRLSGGRPVRSSALAWALGAVLAAGAGILLAGSQGVLSHTSLTLLVVNAYAAAMFGRLRSLSLTFLGALALGLLQSYAIGYLSLERPVRSILGIGLDPPLSLNGLRPAIPIVALFVVLLALPTHRVRAHGQRASRLVVPAPRARRWLVGAVAIGVAAFGCGTWFGGTRTNQFGQGLALGIVMLSLVPLIGYAGQISLAPMTFAGVGAVVMGSWGGAGTLWGLVLAAVVSALVGAVVALPALRLQGLYLALATAAFAVFMDLNFFNQNRFLPNGNRGVPRLDLPGISFDGDRAHLVLIGVAFGLVASMIVRIRRAAFGRRLLAMRSSAAACVTLGVDLTVTKVEVFALSAGIAGLGGALYGGQLHSVGPTTFQFLQSLPVVLLAVAGGIAAVGGALFGAVAFAVAFLVVPDLFPALRDVLSIAPALAGVSLGRNPNGAVNEMAEQLRARRSSRGAVTAVEVEVEASGIDAPGVRRWLDRATGLEQEPLYALARSARDPEGVANGEIGD